MARGKTGVSEGRQPEGRQTRLQQRSSAEATPRLGGSAEGILASDSPRRGPVEGSRRRDPSAPLAVYNRWCKGCEICVEFCPRKVLELSKEGKALVAHPEKCTRCRLCEVLCPDFAITVFPKAKPRAEAPVQIPRGEPVARGRGEQ